MTSSLKQVSFSIDRGGTFTDVYCEVHDGAHSTPTTKVMKLLSVDPENYPDAPREGIRRFLESELGVPLPRNEKIPTAHIRSIRMGTTVATNALLERQVRGCLLPRCSIGFYVFLSCLSACLCVCVCVCVSVCVSVCLPVSSCGGYSHVVCLRVGAWQGERTALVTTKGFRDLLHIANQSRPNIFDLEIRMPENLYEEVVEVDEEVGLPLRNGPARRSGGMDEDWYDAVDVVDSSEPIAVRRAVDVESLKEDLKRVKAKGITSLAVVLKHSALFPDHERLVGDIALSMGFEQVRTGYLLLLVAAAVLPLLLLLLFLRITNGVPAAGIPVVHGHADGQNGPERFHGVGRCVPYAAYSEVHSNLYGRLRQRPG
jgi:hypothetical protein